MKSMYWFVLCCWSHLEEQQQEEIPIQYDEEEGVMVVGMAIWEMPWYDWIERWLFDRNDKIKVCGWWYPNDRRLVLHQMYIICRYYRAVGDSWNSSAILLFVRRFLLELIIIRAISFRNFEGILLMRIFFGYFFWKRTTDRLFYYFRAAVWTHICYWSLHSSLIDCSHFVDVPIIQIIHSTLYYWSIIYYGENRLLWDSFGWIYLIKFHILTYFSHWSELSSVDTDIIIFRTCFLESICLKIPYQFIIDLSEYSILCVKNGTNLILFWSTLMRCVLNTHVMCMSNFCLIWKNYRVHLESRSVSQWYSFLLGLLICWRTSTSIDEQLPVFITLLDFQSLLKRHKCVRLNQPPRQPASVNLNYSRSLFN